MGCVSSKLLKKTLKDELLFGNGDSLNHVVSLTSTTYGALKLDRDHTHLQINQIDGVAEQKGKQIGAKVEAISSEKSPQKEGLEVINAWELMGDLEEEMPISNQKNKSPKLLGFRGGKEDRSPFKSLTLVGSPKIGKKSGGKENTPKGVLNSSTNSSSKSRKASSLESPRRSSSGILPSRRKSLNPLFDPKLIESFEKELSQETEQIKKMVSPKRYSNINSLSILETYEEKCPPLGQNVVVIYTTTLRGIRKTFEDCNVVRTIIESYQIRLIERDVSMDSGFKEELRKLMCTKEVKVPLVFVKGRMLGGANEVVKLEEEGKLEGLFDGIPKAKAICEGCGGIRFIMCGNCNGSCKVLDEDQNKSVRCGECNENGLVKCPICC